MSMSWCRSWVLLVALVPMVLGTLSCTEQPSPRATRAAIGGSDSGLDASFDSGWDAAFDAAFDAGPAPTPTEVVIASADTFVAEGAWANQNFAASPVLKVEPYPSRARSLVQFDTAAIAQAVAGRHIDAARIELTVTGVSGEVCGSDQRLELHRVIQSYELPQATWECAIDGDPSDSGGDCDFFSSARWQMEYPPSWPFIKIETFSHEILPTLSGTLSFDVTNEVASMLVGATPNLGWLLKLDPWAEGATAGVQFASLEHTDATARPRLALYLSPANPGAPLGCVRQGFDTSCNGVDDDCDGNVDESFDPAPISCGGSACASTGVTACVDATVVDNCQPAAPCNAVANAVVEVVGDTHVSDWQRVSEVESNFGTASTLRVPRALVFADTAELVAAVGTHNLLLATLDLTTTRVGPYWKSDRTIEVHRLLVPSGELVATGSCPIDSDVSNNDADCDINDRWTWTQPWVQQPTTVHTTTDGVWGTQRLDITQDIQSILDGTVTNYGWTLYEGAWNMGDIEFFSREGSASRGPRISLWFAEATCTTTGVDDDCNGVDEDCDGIADDAYVGTATTCGAGYCTGQSTTLCVNGEVVDPCEPPANCFEPVGAACTDDTDCSLLGPGAQCLTDEATGLLGGYCTVFCSNVEGSVVECPDGNMCTGETCVALCDNDTCRLNRHDCVDIGYESNVCVPTCETHAECGEGRRCQEYRCVPPGCAADDLTCDGFDNDCDGQLDEGYVSTPTSCGSGTCVASGVTSCVAGGVVDSCEPGAPTGSDNDCNGNDDDCDGTTDESYVSVSSSCGVGVCSSTGATSCVNGGVVDSCTPGGTTGNDTDCDGIDDDCDSNVDEAYVSQSITCGVGSCLARGLRTCNAGATSDVCTSRVASSDDALCDSLDSDCDGVVDEDYVPVVVTCGVGACAATGTSQCTVAGQLDVCVPGTPASTDDCNGNDDDCDGRVDEGFVSTAVACGVGACEVSAATGCVAGVVVDLCFPGTASSTDSDCDGWDGDCDGEVDEAFVSTCDGSAVLSCPDGLLTRSDCDDSNACNGEETCNAGACVAGAAPVLDDGNACTTDTCDPVLGLAHQPLAIEAACDDGCLGVGQCRLCQDSANLLGNGSFEARRDASTIYSSTPNLGQGVLPSQWFTMNSTPDVFSSDGSYGLAPSGFSSFTGVTAADGIQWVAGGSESEAFAQQLAAPLEAGQRYRVTAKLHQHSPSSFVGGTALGSYEVSLSDYYGGATPTFPRVVLGTLGPTVSFSEGWVERSFEFVAPSNAATQSLFALFPRRHTATAQAYPAIDDVQLVKLCSGEALTPVCVHDDPVMLDDENPCTVDACGPSGPMHTPVAAGTACHGGGTCDASGLCSNQPPVFTSTPIRWVFVPDQGSTTLIDQATAVDPNPGQSVTYSIALPPPGLQINYGSPGRIFGGFNYAQLGLYRVRIRATDSLGAFTDQNYLLQVVLNHGPETLASPYITSQPGTQTTVGSNYVYDVEAVDDPESTLGYSLSMAPAGMNIDPVSGLVTWIPDETQVGPHSIGIVVTDAGGHEGSQFYTLLVTAPNAAPVIESVPTTRTTVDLPYVYEVLARDAEGEALSYGLSSSPAGMTIGAQDGVLTWVPGATDAGAHSIAVVATDAVGNTTTQSYTLTVVHPIDQHLPVITSTPGTSGTQGGAYTYTLTATDEDGDALAFVATTLPAGAAFDPLTAAVRWVPGAAQLGDNSFDLSVSDGFHTLHQVWTVAVSRTNTAPRIVSSPSLHARVGEGYGYQCSAIDVEGDALTYTMLQAPEGMTLGAHSGDVNWSPAPNQQGAHTVVLRVADALGAASVQTFVIAVGSALPPNQPPVFVSAPPSSVSAGAVLVYDAEAIDPEGGGVSFSVVDAPTGMTLDSSTGVMQWIGVDLGSYPVTLRATDGQGASADQTFGLVVSPDITAPSLTLTASRARFAPGESTVLTVSAQDASGVPTTALYVDSVQWPLDENGQVSYTSRTSGPHLVTATATDAFGNTSSRDLLLAVTQPGDLDAPVVTLAPGVADGVFTMIHDVLGTVNDANLLRYTLAIRREGATAWQTLQEDRTPVIDGALGQVDATLLRNGIYQMRIHAEDLNGLTTELTRPIQVDGAAKVGVVQLSFLDLSHPIDALPMLLTRHYDSRDKEVGDFGVGWRMGLKYGSIQHNRPVGGYYALYTLDGGTQGSGTPCTQVNEQRPHYTMVRVSEHESYVFAPRLSGALAVSGGCTAYVHYEQVGGTHDGATLTIAGSTLVRADRHIRVANTSLPESFPMNLVDAFTLDPFNPTGFYLELADGRSFDMTTQEGIVAMFDQRGSSMVVRPDVLGDSDGRRIDLMRDGLGRVTRATHPDGKAVSYTYNANGDLVAVTDPGGSVTRFTYFDAPAHHLKSIIGPDGIELAALDYDADGRLAAACDGAGLCNVTTHNVETRTETITDATFGQTAYTYDTRGNVTSQTDALGHTTSFEYDARDNVLRAEGPDGSVATYQYDNLGQMTQRILPHEANEDAADFTYNYTFEGDHRTSVILPSGGSLHWSYADGWLTQIADAAGNVIQSRTADPNYNSTVLDTITTRFGTTAYRPYRFGDRSYTDPFGNEVTIVAGGPDHTASERTEHGKTILRRHRPDSGATTFLDYGDDKTVTFSYDGQPSNWTSIEGPTIGRITRSFNKRGQLTRWVDANGDTHARFYDGAGRVIREVNPLGNETAYSYDAAGRLETITDAALNATTTFERDEAGRVTRVIDPLGRETITSYKLGGRIESTTNARGYSTSFNRTPTSASITDALSRTTTTHLSPYGLATGTTFADTSSTSSTYAGTTRLDNSQSYPLSFTDESGRAREYGYDTRSGLQQAADLAGNDWSYTYAPTIGSDISYDVESGAVSLNASDAYGFGEGGGSEYRDVSSLSDEHGAMSSAFGHALASVTSPLGETTTYHRNTAGRLDLITYPDGGERSINYDARGLPVSTTLPQGTSVYRNFDSAFREVERTTSTGDTRSMTYGPMDRVETMTDATGTTTYHYDAAGRFVGMTYPQGGSVMYDRDVLSRVTDVRVKTSASATELVTHYVYDNNGNLSALTDPNGGVTSYVYDAVDRLTSRTLPNGVTTTYTYDARDRVLSVVHTGLMSNVLASTTYIRSPSGEPTRVTREDGSYVVLTYDAALRLDTETYYNSADQVLDAIDYGYDADGNRTSKVSLVGGAEAYAYEAGFKLSEVTRGSEVEAFTYDGGGRTIGIERGGVERALEWNVDDKLTRVVDDGVEVASYAYDGAGRRVGSVIGGVAKRYLVAPNVGDGYETPQAITDASGALIAAYVFAGEHPIARITPTGIEYYLQDSMGSVIGATGSAGTSTASIKYDSFGDVTSATGTAASSTSVGGDFRLHGMWLDEVSGLYHVRARTYDASTGRFLSRDPVAGFARRPESMNPYSFCQSNGWRWRDPSGRFSLPEVTAVTAIISTLASVALPALGSYLSTVRGFSAGARAVGSSATETITGVTDTLSFGAGEVLRNALLGALGRPDNIDEDSSDYFAGVGIGLVMSVMQGMVYGTAAALRAAPAIGAAGTTVIGRTPAYLELGEKLAANYLKTLPPKVVAELGEQQIWYMNRVFLDQAIARGDRFIIAGGIKTAASGTWLRSEIDYLLYRGYRLGEDGVTLLVH